MGGQVRLPLANIDPNSMESETTMATVVAVEVIDLTGSDDDAEELESDKYDDESYNPSDVNEDESNEHAVVDDEAKAEVMNDSDTVLDDDVGSGTGSSSSGTTRTMNRRIPRVAAANEHIRQSGSEGGQARRRMSGPRVHVCVEVEQRHQVQSELSHEARRRHCGGEALPGRWGPCVAP